MSNDNQHRPQDHKVPHNGDDASSDPPHPKPYTDLPHARATSHGTYLKGLNDGLESLEQYQEGGYHPVHLGDNVGAYRVIHKLGYGGFGTVWLCTSPSGGYVAVKVMTGDAADENLPDIGLGELDQSVPGAGHIAIPLDSFSVEGPNGKHQCIVLPVLGPCVSPRLWMRMKAEPGPVLRGMARQAAEAMHFLHKNGVCHGDFRPANILVKLKNLDSLPEEELLSLIGQPTMAYVRTESGDELPKSSPQYLVHSADMYRVGDNYMTDQICVIDLGQSFLISSPPEDLGIPENYLPPEMRLDEENAVGPACDLWALGCTLYEIRQQIPLFCMIYDIDELLVEMVRFFGQFPQKWWATWEAREEYFDDDGTYLRDGDEKEEWTLEVSLSKPDEEQKELADLLYKILCYDSAKRPGAEEILEHPWFAMQCV